MEQHKCINKEIIEKLRDENQELKTNYKVLESNVNAVKENIKDMKTKVDNMSKTNIAILTGVILALITAIANFFVK
jgi:peptidoglycan hydrolase CwlO-like protein